MPDKRPKGLRALSALKPSGFKPGKKHLPPSPDDDGDDDVPDYLAIPAIPNGHDNKQLPPTPALMGPRPAPDSVPVPHIAPGSERPVGVRPRPMSKPLPMNPSLDSMNGPMSTIPNANGVPPRKDVQVPPPPPKNNNNVEVSTPRDEAQVPMRNDSPMEPISPSAVPVVSNPSPRAVSPIHTPPNGELPESTSTTVTPHAPTPIRPPSAVPVVPAPVPVIEKSPTPEPPQLQPQSQPQPPAHRTSSLYPDSSTTSTPVQRSTSSTTTSSEEPGTGTDTNPGTGAVTPASTWSPPEVESVAAPLNKVHYACYQGHRAMPVAANAWCPVPCMTCLKRDAEVRHRCVFCCLRVCRECFTGLQKCRGRSLEEFMGSLAVE